MINLIPKEEKKKMIVGFYYKLIVLFLLLMGTSFMILFVATLPAYFLSSAKNNIADLKLETQKQEPAPLPDEQTLVTIKDVNNKLSLIEKNENNKFFVSNNIINPILSKKTSGIKITDIVYTNDSSQGKKIIIQGEATSREILLMFRQALEDGTLFKQVDLPISNFVKGSNIQFTLSLIPS